MLDMNIADLENFYTCSRLIMDSLDLQPLRRENKQTVDQRN